MKKITSEFDARILIVDDYILNLELTKNLLELMKCMVDTAESGTAALEMIAKNDYDLIFMDIQMPEMDGVTTFHKIRAMTPAKNQIPIVALTANALAGDHEKYLSIGMDDYLPKPITGEKLEAILKNHIKPKI